MKRENTKKGEGEKGLQRIKERKRKDRTRKEKKVKKRNEKRRKGIKKEVKE